MSSRLYINVDHVATVRQARKTDEPDPVAAAQAAVAGGADGITVHLREDRRHIQDHDVERLSSEVATVLNLELARSSDIVDLACRLKPHQATLVPEKRQEITTEGGLDLSDQGESLKGVIQRLASSGIRVSLFIDPEPEAIQAAAALGVPAIELHTGRYAHASKHDPEPELAELAAAARLAEELGLAVHAGHGLTYRNVSRVAALPVIEEFNIGHSVVSRALLTGMEVAVREMCRLVKGR